MSEPKILTATEVEQRWKDWSAKIAEHCKTPAGLLGFLIAAEQVGYLVWKKDKERFDKLNSNLEGIFE